MADSNRTQVLFVKESTLGTTPATPRMRAARITSESLSYDLTYTQSEELRADRMTSDTVATQAKASGGTNFEFSFPVDGTYLSEMIAGGLFNTWVNAPVIDNDGTADGAITDAGTTTDTYAVASGGAAFKAGHLCRATGFSQSANNQIFKVASSSGTTVVGSSLSLVAETAPAAAARLKVVGFEAGSGDVTATASGLASTTLSFVTMGLTAGMWIKIGGTLTGQKFATAANNAWVRVTAVTATALTCDNLPVGWGVDSGAGKTIRVWFGDTIKNGVTKQSYTFEKGFLDQTTPSYIAYAGMVVGTLNASVATGAIMTGSVDFTGTGATVSTTALDASPDAATTVDVLNSVNNVGRVAEGGALITGGNYISKIDLAVANNLRDKNAVGQLAMIDVGAGDCAVTGTIETYFGSKDLLDKYLNGTETSLNWRVEKSGQALVTDLPRVKFESGSPNAGGKNQDVMLALTFRGLRNATFDSQIQMTRVEYYE